jgi:O-antigen ligase
VWLGLVVGVVVACLQEARLRRLLPGLLVAGGVAVAVALTTVPSLQAAVEARATTTRSVDDRRNVNEAALRVVAQHPLDGVGWQRFVEVSDQYVRQADDYPITNIGIEVHNVPLARAAETGIPGAALWVLAVVLGPLLAVVRRPRARAGEEDLPGWRLVLTVGAAAWGVAQLLSPVPYPFPNYVVFLVAGVVLRPYLTRPGDGAGDGTGAAAATLGRPGQGG